MSLLSVLLVLLAAPARGEPKEKQIRPLPTLAREPKVDGVLKDFVGATELKTLGKDAKALVTKVGFRKDTLYLAATLPGQKEDSTDVVTVELFFPGAGTTARGYKYLFGVDGQHKDPVAAPSWGQELVQVGSAADKKGLNFEIAVPGRAFPRFPGSGQLAVQLCVSLVKKDSDDVISNCEHGDMPGGPTRIPDELRKNLKLNPPAHVEGVEARPTGWVGFAVLHYPAWVQGDEDLTPSSIAELTVGDAAVEAIKVDLPIPTSLTLPDMRPIFTVLTGKNPYAKDECHAENELRMAMYVVKGNIGSRVLEWPAATCSLGRAMRFELNPEGQLTIGYTNGSTAHFVWSGDHFERSELGSK